MLLPFSRSKYATTFLSHAQAWPADRLRSPHTRALIGTAAVALQSRLKSMGLQSLDLYLAGDASVDISERGDSHQIPVHQPLLPEGAMHEAPRDVWDAMAPLTAEEWAASVGSAKTLGLAAAVGTGGELVEGSEVAQVRDDCLCSMHLKLHHCGFLHSATVHAWLVGAHVTVRNWRPIRLQGWGSPSKRPRQSRGGLAGHSTRR
mgnify:CR=1 FL=1